MQELDRHSNIDNTESKAGAEERAVTSDEVCTDEPTDVAVAAAKNPKRVKAADANADSSGSSKANNKASSKASNEIVDDDDDFDNLPKVSRKVRRRRRRTRPRSKTIAMKRLTREELRKGALMYPPVDIPRPQTRAECMVEKRPCPWVACKHHLYLDVNPVTGSIKINFPDLEPWELPETCALDVAARGGITLEEVGEIMNLTRERIRQVEVRGLHKLRVASPSPEELGANPIEE